MIKKGDNVIILTGTDKGKKAKVLKSFPKEGMIVVEGVNVKKRHMKRRRTDQQGEIVERSMPIPFGNAALLDPKTGKPTRLGKKKVGDKMVRIAKKSGSEI